MSSDSIVSITTVSVERKLNAKSSCKNQVMIRIRKNKEGFRTTIYKNGKKQLSKVCCMGAPHASVSATKMA